MDLFCLEKDSKNLSYTLDEWKKMVGHDPAGTMGMKAPEVGNKYSDVQYISYIVIIDIIFYIS